MTIDTVDSIWNLIFDTVLVRSSQPHFVPSKIYYLYFIAYNAQEILGLRCVICVSNMVSTLQLLLRDEEIATSIVLYIVGGASLGID